MTADRVMIGILYVFLLLAILGLIGWGGFWVIGKASLGRPAQIVWGIFCLVAAAVLLIFFIARWPQGVLLP